VRPQGAPISPSSRQKSTTALILPHSDSLLAVAALHELYAGEKTLAAHVVHFLLITVITAATSEGARAKLQYYRSYVSAEEALGRLPQLAGGSERAVTPQQPP